MTSERRPPQDLQVRDRMLTGVSKTDAQAKERARARLHHAIQDEGRPSSAAAQRTAKSRDAVALVIALGLVATIAILLLPPDAGGPRFSAATELRRLGVVASSQRTPLRLERYPVRQESLLRRGVHLIDEGEFMTVVRQSVTGWVEPDGSGRRRIEVLDARFADPEDEAAWRELGAPPVLLEPGDVLTETYGPGELPFHDLSRLPLHDLGALRRAVEDGAIGEVGSGAKNMLSLIGRALAQPDATPPTRKALFDLASTLRGVRLLPEGVTDPLGRVGIGVGLAAGAYDSQIIVDATTSNILALVDRPVGDLQEPATWTAYLE